MAAVALAAFVSDQRGYRAVYAETHGPLPYVCEYCGEPIVKLGVGRGCLVIHHVDEDRSNNEPSNLAPMHWECHTRHHRAGIRLSMAYRARISEGLRGRPVSPETRSRISASLEGNTINVGRVLSAETREKIAAAQGGVPEPPRSAETRARLSSAMKGREINWAEGISASLREVDATRRASCVACRIEMPARFFTRHQGSQKCTKRAERVDG